MDNKKQIGYFVLKEDHEFTNTYECAAWYENVLVKTGRYPLEVYDFCIKDMLEGKEIDGYIGCAFVSLPGTITSDEFGMRFYGVPIGTYDNSQNKGKESEYHFYPELYAIADSLLRPGNSIFSSEIWEYELFPEYEPKDITFISSIDGIEVTTHGIFLKEGYINEEH